MNVEIDRYLRRTGMTKAALSTKALGDSKRVQRLMNGESRFTEYTEKRLRRFMADHPEGIPPGKPGRPPKVRV